MALGKSSELSGVYLASLQREGERDLSVSRGDSVHPKSSHAGAWDVERLEEPLKHTN